MLMKHEAQAILSAVNAGQTKEVQLQILAQNF